MPNKVKCGFFSFTEILDHDHRNYNEWHMLDHQPEQYQMPGCAWGQRWVCTPTHAAQRVASDPWARAHYVTLYLFTQPVRETLVEFTDLGRDLRQVARFHKKRVGLMSGAFTALKTWAAPRVLIGGDVIPMRPHHGIFVSMIDAERERLDETRRWIDDVYGPTMITLPGVAGTWWFESLPNAPHGSEAKPLPAGRIAIVSWIDDADVSRVAERIREHPFSPAGAATLLTASAYDHIPWHSKFDWFD